MDVDNFKQVNDGFGHPEGDRVLQEIAAFLSRNLRKDDVVARLGGDEFAVFAAGLVPGPALDRVLSQLSGGIYATTPRPADMPEGLHPSITIGAVACTRTPVTFDDLYQVCLLYTSSASVCAPTAPSTASPSARIARSPISRTCAARCAC